MVDIFRETCESFLCSHSRTLSSYRTIYKIRFSDLIEAVIKHVLNLLNHRRSSSKPVVPLNSPEDSDPKQNQCISKPNRIARPRRNKVPAYRNRSNRAKPSSDAPELRNPSPEPWPVPHPCQALPSPTKAGPARPRPRDRIRPRDLALDNDNSVTIEPVFITVPDPDSTEFDFGEKLRFFENH